MVQIVITFEPQTGAFQVKAPPDPILALGLLEAAKQTIHMRNQKQNDGPSIIPAKMVPKLSEGR